MKVEAFIFDIGNVLVRFDERKIADALTARGIDPAVLTEVRALSGCYERGEADRATFLGKMEALLGGRITRDELITVWQEIFEPNRPVWELVEQLHGSYPLYLLSNTNCLHHEYLAREYAVFAKFADGVFSYRERMMKPERGIFDLAIRRFGVQPGATIYLDDLAANVEAARGAGLRAFVYHPDEHDGCLASLRAQGVQCG